MKREYGWTFFFLKSKKLIFINRMENDSLLTEVRFIINFYLPDPKVWVYIGWAGVYLSVEKDSVVLGTMDVGLGSNGVYQLFQFDVMTVTLI